MQVICTALLRVYKFLISPWMPGSCCYVPSCSEYAAEAVATHGILYGAALACWRLLRCNPLAHGGYDPVPRNRLRSTS